LAILLGSVIVYFVVRSLLTNLRRTHKAEYDF
jgi:hypothetical protein